MVKKILSIVLLLFASPCWATTYYMAPAASGGSDSNDGSSGNPWLTLSHSFSAMGGGNTLIIRDGTYTGTSNQITGSNLPPAGTSGAYTIIKAENDGAVDFDGGGTTSMFYATGADHGNRYTQYEGLVWHSGSDPVQFQGMSYVKFLRCGAYDAANGEHAVFLFGGNTSDQYRCTYILVEGCYSYGNGRYKFATFHADHVIFRNCVVRSDLCNSGGEPIAGFAAYTSQYVAYQNCIVIDSDQSAYWTNYSADFGSFFIPDTSGASNNITYDQCIVLNSHLGGLWSANNTGTSTTDYWRNCVVWNVPNPVENINQLRALSQNVTNCTFGATNTGSNNFIWVENGVVWKNNIITGITTSASLLTFGSSTQDYNSYYNNSNNTGRSGTHDLTAVNPLAASLLYLPRIESGSALDGAGESSADIGANAVTLIGAPGTLWGESGTGDYSEYDYDDDTSVSMWPFPNEDLIKTKMAAYTWDDGGGGDPEITGARGFAVSGTQLNGTDQVTLTSYVWEYLGNQMPSSIYGVQPRTQISSGRSVVSAGRMAITAQ